MEEQNKEQNQQPATDTGTGNLPSTANVLDRADSLNQRLEQNIKKSEELSARIEAAAARILLSGRADAGIPVKTKEQKEAEDIKAEIEKNLKMFSRR
jgi:hypothetical protein